MHNFAIDEIVTYTRRVRLSWSKYGGVITEKIKEHQTTAKIVRLGFPKITIEIDSGGKLLRKAVYENTLSKIKAH